MHKMCSAEDGATTSGGVGAASFQQVCLSTADQVAEVQMV